MQLSRSVHGHCQGYTGHLRKLFLYQKEICFSQFEMKLKQPHERETQCILHTIMKKYWDLSKIHIACCSCGEFTLCGTRSFCVLHVKRNLALFSALVSQILAKHLDIWLFDYLVARKKVMAKNQFLEIPPAVPHCKFKISRPVVFMGL